MGESTFVGQKAFQGGAVRQLRAVRQGLDLILVGVTLVLTLFGLLMVYSAGPKFASYMGMPSDYFVVRQLMWAGLGLIAISAATFINYHFYQKLTVLMMAVTILALAFVMVVGNSTLGSVRSLAGGSIRPSELAKLVTIIYISVWLNSKREVLNDITLGLIPLGFILGVNALLIFFQPDLSAAMTVLILGGLLFFLAGGEWRQIGIVIAIAVLVAWFGLIFTPPDASVSPIIWPVCRIRWMHPIMSAGPWKPSSTAGCLGLALAAAAQNSPGCPWPIPTQFLPSLRKRPGSSVPACSSWRT
jgi:cell division protein FtsW